MDISSPQQRYEMLQAPGGGLRLPPQRRPPPLHGEPPRGAARGGGRSRCLRRGCCGRCLCFCCCFLLLFLIAVGVAGAYLYHAYRPRIPRYSIKSLAVTALDIHGVGGELALHVRLVAAVRATNPNDKIGIAYGEGSRVRVMYRGEKLCGGRLPIFYQGRRNATVVRVAMEGRRALDGGLREELRKGQERGRIPLDVLLRVRVALRVGEVEIRQVVVDVRCSLVVDGLSPGKDVHIKSAANEVNVAF